MRLTACRHGSIGFRASAASPGVAELDRPVRDPVAELGRRCLEPSRQRERRAQPVELLVQQLERGRAQGPERVPSDLGGDEWVSVAITAHPRPERQARSPVLGQQRQIETSVAPGEIEPVVDPSHHLGKHLAEVVDDVGQLELDVGLLQQHVAGAPQQLEHRGDPRPHLRVLRGGPHLVLALDEQAVEGTVVGERAGPLGLGGVGGEHRLDPHSGELLGE